MSSNLKVEIFDKKWEFTDDYPLKNRMHNQLYGASAVSLSNEFIEFGGNSYPG